jgi:hypothetical protein
MTQAVSAQGTQVHISNAPATQANSPTAYTRIAEIVQFSREGDRPEIDASNLDSEAREYRLGLKDEGTLSFEANWIASDAGQNLMVSALASADPWDFKIVYPNGKTHYFQALVKKWDITAGVDQILKRQAQVRLSGPVTEV